MRPGSPQRPPRVIGRRWPAAVAGVYLAGGIAVWVSFATTNPDGLANVGLLLYVLPITLLGLVLGKAAGSSEFLLIPRNFGYLPSHALFFFPSLLAVAGGIYWVAGTLRRWFGR